MGLAVSAIVHDVADSNIACTGSVLVLGKDRVFGGLIPVLDLAQSILDAGRT
ncbi:MAG: hypothetical protein AAGJ94_13745 [Pseudomonadota bacterium]